MKEESITTATDTATGERRRLITDPGPRNPDWRDPAEAALRDLGGFETGAERAAFRAGFEAGGWTALSSLEDLAQRLAAELGSAERA